FLEIARLRSFTKAAERIPMSSSGMSMLVKELEQQVGARLFERDTRSVALTEAGRRLQPVAERIVAELDALGGVISGTEAAVRSRLDVAATPMVAATLFPDVVQAFTAAHPEVQVHLADVDLGLVRQRVLDKQADIGFGFFVKPAAGLLRQTVCRFRMMRVSRPAGASSGRGRSQPWSQLAGVPLVSFPVDNPIQALIEPQLVRLGRSHEERPRVNLIGTIIGMVRAGRGDAVLPSFALDECLRHGLDVAMLVDPAVHIDLYVVSRRGAQDKPAAADFTAALRVAGRRVAG
ncbi:MAG: LysR family transcriptional regulator, partial [Comamonadaceae bacterium]